MLKIYGSKYCGDCVACCNSLDAANVKYEYVDITSSMPNLKEYLALRDTMDMYADVRKNHTVGIPTLLLEDGTYTMDYEKYLKDNNIEAKPVMKACNLDGTGC